MFNIEFHFPNRVSYISPDYADNNDDKLDNFFDYIEGDETEDLLPDGELPSDYFFNSDIESINDKKNHSTLFIRWFENEPPKDLHKILSALLKTNISDYKS